MITYEKFESYEKLYQYTAEKLGVDSGCSILRRAVVEEAHEAGGRPEWRQAEDRIVEWLNHFLDEPLPFTHDNIIARRWACVAASIIAERLRPFRAQSPCVVCGKPTIAGVNSDFCSVDCEDFWETSQREGAFDENPSSPFVSEEP